MPKTKHVTLYILYLSLVVLIASACGDGDTTDLRLIHASPDSPAIDVYVAGDSTPIFEDISYGETSEYKSIDSGIADLEIRPAGAPSDSEPVFTQDDVILDSDSRFTGVIAGLVDSSTPGNRARLELLSENFDPAQPGAARVRLVHASPDAPTLAVDVNDDGSREIAELNRFSSTEEAGIEIPADMPLTIGLWAGEPLERFTTFTIPALAEGEEIFVVASGQIERMPREEAGFSLLVVGPSGAPTVVKQNPALMALHGIPDGPAVDLYDGSETLLASNVTFGSLSEPILLPAGALELTVIESGQPATAAPLTTFTTPALEPGNRYLATVAGSLKVTGPEIQLVVHAEDFAVDDPSNAQFAFLHASPDAPAIDISTVIGDLLALPALVSNLDFGKVFPSEGSVSVPPATYMMGIAPATIREPIATFELQATAGMREFAIVLGLLFPGDNEPLGIFLIDTTVFPWTVLPIPLMMVGGGA